MRWKPELVKDSARPAETGEGPVLSERLRTALESRGLDAPLAEALALRLVPHLEGTPAGMRERILDGVALGVRAQGSLSEELTRSAGELQEMERLMSSFAGELSKLDEVLEVLAAYLRRMRTTSGSGALH
jgi:hypothetical protein